MNTAPMRIAGESQKKLAKRQTLTKSLIERLTCPTDRRAVVIYDVAVPSLCLHVTKSNRSFYVYRKLHGRPVRYRLGGYPDLTPENARTMALKDLGQMVQGNDPREVRRRVRTSMTLDEVFAKWEKEYAKPRHRPRTLETDKNRFDTCFDGWKGRKVGSVKEADVRTLHVDLAESRGKTTANRAVQLLRRLLNFARITPNPAGGRAVSFFRETPRDRFLQPDEMPRFFTALDAELNETLRDALKVLLLTGARRSNVQAMRWDEVDVKAGKWTIPAEKFKNHQPMTVHLVDAAKVILQQRKDAMRPEKQSEWVFPSKRKDPITPHVSELKGAWARVLKAAKIKDLRVHDLRRTMGSWQAITGASLPVIGKSLGHMNQATTAIYARLNLDPVRASVDLAANAMLAASKVKEEKAAGTIEGPSALRSKKKKVVKAHR